jgi:hypothetical protein
VAKGYAGPEDAEKGVPFRHARAKARLLLMETTEGEKTRVLEILIGSRPNEVLNALCEVVDG